MKKKPSISLKMSSKTIEIFKKASMSLKISLKCHAFFRLWLAQKVFSNKNNLSKKKNKIPVNGV
jgi:hypothetical protein